MNPHRSPSRRCHTLRHSLGHKVFLLAHTHLRHHLRNRVERPPATDPDWFVKMMPYRRWLDQRHNLEEKLCVGLIEPANKFELSPYPEERGYVWEAPTKEITDED